MTVHYTYPTTTTPVFDASAPGVNYLGMPEDSDGFIDKVVDAFSRGKSQALAGVAITEAIDNPNLDLNEALRVRAKLQRNEQLNPLESNWLSDVVYSSSRAAGQMFEGVKKAGVGAVVGGAVGAGVGLLLPTVGEEIPLIALGAKFGATVQSALFSFRSGRGEMYADMLDQGVSHDTAKLASGIAGIPYALIEVAQLKVLAPAIKIGASQVAKASALRFVKKAAKMYGTTLTKEVMEEIGQEGIQIVAEDVAKYLDGQGVSIDNEYFKDRASRIWTTAKEATKGFALLPIPGTAIEVGLQYHGAAALQEIEQAEQKVNQKQIIDPSDVDSPIGKVQIAIDNSVNTWDAQERIRSKEKGIRIAEAKRYTGVVSPPGAEVFYHGSPVAGLTEIKPGRGDYGYGVYLASERRAQKDYAPGRKNVAAYVLGDTNVPPPKGFVYPVQSSMKNPLIINTEQEYTKLLDEHGDSDKGISKFARKAKYDGIINKYTEEHIVFTDKPIPVTQPAPVTEAQKERIRSKEKVDGIIKEWGTRNQYYLKNPYRKQMEDMAVTKKWDETVLRKADRWEMEQVLKDKPAFLPDYLPDDEVITFVNKNNLVYDYVNLPWTDSNYRILAIAQDKHSLQKVRDAKNQRELGLALGYENILTETQYTPVAKTKQPVPQETRQQQLWDWKVRTKMALKGEYTKLGIRPLEELIPIENYAIMHQELGVTDKLDRFETLNLDDALEKLFKEGVLPRPFERKLFGKMWGPGIEQSLDTLTEIVEDKGPDILDYFNLPKIMSAAMDLSGTARQNVLMIGEPKLWFKALARNWNLLIRDDKTARTLENDMQLRLAKAGDLLTKTGIRWNKYGGKAGYKISTEKYASKLAGRIPGVAQSERAFTVGGNLLRGEKILQVAEQREGYVTTDKQWKDIGHVVNLLTGEGDARIFGRLAPILNAIFFAPRLAEARFRSIIDIFNPNLSWAARKILAWDMAKAIGINIGILGTMSLVPGVEVETDYRATDFGKIKYGNTRIDFWGGYLPIARLVMRLYAGKVKTQSGRVIDVEARDTITSFLQTKLGPVPAYLLDLIRGETFYGDYVGITEQSLTNQFYHRFVPFIIQDIIDAIQYQGWKTGVIGGALAFHGVGVQTYPMSKGSEVLMRKNSLTMEVLGRKWDETGPDVQAYLRENFPQIEIMERQAAYDRSNLGFLEKIANERDATIERMTKKMSSDVRDELTLLNLKIGGIGRTISTDWFLNENRTKDYEQQVTKAYQEILPKIIRLDHWNRIPPQTKVEILTEVMNEIKKGIRDQIVAGANISDFQQIRRGNK